MKMTDTLFFRNDSAKRGDFGMTPQSGKIAAAQCQPRRCGRGCRKPSCFAQPSLQAVQNGRSRSSRTVPAVLRDSPQVTGERQGRRRAARLFIFRKSRTFMSGRMRTDGKAGIRRFRLPLPIAGFCGGSGEYPEQLPRRTDRRRSGRPCWQPYSISGCIPSVPHGFPHQYQRQSENPAPYRSEPHFSPL